MDIRDFVVGAKFYLAHIIMAANYYTEKEDMEQIVEIDYWCDRDLRYFSLVLPIYGHRVPLQDPDWKPRATAVKVYTDAA